VPVPYSHRVKAAPDVLFRQMGDEAVVLNLKTELYLGLDAVGTRIWALLQDAPTIQAAYESLLDEYDVDPERLRHDLGEFLEELVDQALVETIPNAL
jgi:coenzyme PQQ synthesis protein D (PqqD)